MVHISERSLPPRLLSLDDAQLDVVMLATMGRAPYQERENLRRMLERLGLAIYTNVHGFRFGIGLSDARSHLHDTWLYVYGRGHIPVSRWEFPPSDQAAMDKMINRTSWLDIDHGKDRATALMPLNLETMLSNLESKLSATKVRRNLPGISLQTMLREERLLRHLSMDFHDRAKIRPLGEGIDYRVAHEVLYHWGNLSKQEQFADMPQHLALRMYGLGDVATVGILEDPAALTRGCVSYPTTLPW